MLQCGDEVLMAKGKPFPVSSFQFPVSSFQFPVSRNGTERNLRIFWKLETANWKLLQRKGRPSRAGLWQYRE
jgi:hypothetical protein